MGPLRSLQHLAVRFFETVTSTPLGPRQQAEVREALTSSEATVFFRQQPIDQRHAYEVARRVMVALPGDGDAVAAALLHDVGKVHSRLGPVSRSLATVCDAVHLPMPVRWRAYRDHGALGAADLEAAGARPLAVAFAAGEETGDGTVWRALVAADNAVRHRETPENGGVRNSMPPEVNR
jgi:hypothetical protein